MNAHETQETLLATWPDRIPDAEWQVYQPLLADALDHGLEFAVGGGIAFSHYARRWRNTKDLDLYVYPKDRALFIELVTRHGFVDLYETASYDRTWIYRSQKPPVIIDIMWEMANHRTQNDTGWLARGDVVLVRGIPLRMLPPEELLWAKLYVLQRDRSDWTDLLNVIYGSGGRIDWDYLLRRVRPDERLIGALLNIYAWLCPGAARELNPELWQKLSISAPGRGPNVDWSRVRLIDSRDWFGPNV